MVNYRRQEGYKYIFSSKLSLFNKKLLPLEALTDY